MLDSNTKGLKALHRILIQARHLAQTDSDCTKLASILDYAEILPLYLLDQENRTEDFQMQIAGLGEDLPEFAGLVKDFEANNL